jgi:hypothetical protein
MAKIFKGRQVGTSYVDLVDPPRGIYKVQCKLMDGGTRFSLSTDILLLSTQSFHSIWGTIYFHIMAKIFKDNFK